MLQANLIVENKQTTQERARVAIAAYAAARSDEQVSPGSIPLRKGRHLDVDEVLARSLPKALGPQLQTITGMILSLGRRSTV
jgi:hypothetical protein